ncbi:MAG: thiamine pyrophosphate-binding protein [bacterium]|nr:thiamine pyrophosphate-binding protein [bacterium]
MGGAGSLAEVAMSRLAAAGTDLMFGVPGGGPNIDMIEKGAEAGIRFVLTHGETAACISAGVYGNLTRSPGLAAVTRGPGVTSAANGMAQATLDRFPVLLLSDAVPAAERDRFVHQRLDQNAIMAPLTKWTGTLGYENPAEVVERAARLAVDSPAGGVHLDFDLTAPGDLPPEPPLPTRTDPEALEAARRMVATSIRPLFLVGAAAAPHTEEVRMLVEGLGAPALVTYQAKGVIPDTSPSYGGLFTNALSERPLVEAADLIVAVELDPVEPLARPWPYTTPVLALNHRPLSDSYYPVAVEVNGPLDGSLRTLQTAFSTEWPKKAGPEHNGRVLEDLHAESRGFSPFELMDAVAEASPDDPIVTVDAGAHFLVIMPFWRVSRPLDLLISNGLATMGFALPAAIGAGLARPGRPVLCLTGDGGLGMAMAELETVVRLDLDVTVVVFNDSALSLIEIKQDGQGPEGSRPYRYGPSDFAAAARAMGMDGYVATEPDQVRRALASGRGPKLIDARVSPEVYTHVIETARG